MIDHYDSSLEMLLETRRKEVTTEVMEWFGINDLLKASADLVAGLAHLHVGATVLLLRAFISACHSILVCQNRTAPSASRDEESKSQTSRSSSRFSRHRSKSKSKRSRAHTAPTEPKRASSDAEIMSPIDDSSLDGDAPSIAGTATISSDEVSDDPVHSDDELRQGKKLGSIGRAPSASKRFLRSHASALTSLAQSIYEVLTDILATVEDNRKAMVSILEDGTEMKSQDGCADALIDAFFVMRRLPGLAIDLSGTRVVTRTTSSGCKFLLHFIGILLSFLVAFFSVFSSGRGRRMLSYAYSICFAK